MVDQGNYKNFSVAWFDESDNYVTSSIITDDVISLPLFTDTGSGEVNTAELLLSGNFGNFITSNGSRGFIVEQFDRIRIQIDDLAGNSYDRFYEVKPAQVPSKNKSDGGYTLNLSLLGTEYHTQNVHFSGMFWFVDAFEVARKIGEVYNENRGSRQPLLVQHTLGYVQATRIGNGMPKFTVNHYEYGLHEDFCYNRWMDMLDKLGGSVASGGILDFFEIAFETPAVNQIDLALFLSGDRTRDRDDDANHVTIKQTDSINVGETEGGLSAETATVVASWGSQRDGSIPVGHSKYVSGVAQFVFRPVWDDQLLYKIGSRIKHLSKHYKRIDTDVSGSPPFTTPDADADWEQVDMDDEFGGSQQYSEWTDDKFREWGNCCANPNATTGGTETLTGTGAGMWDSNLVILDNREGEKFLRSWVDFRAKDDTELATADDRWAYSSAINLFPIGTRCLVDGTGADTFAGNDSNGVPFTNNIAEFDGDEWLVKYSPAISGKTDLDEMQIAVIDEMKMYKIAVNPTHTWSEETGDLATDCFHPYKTIKAVASFDTKPTETDSTNHPDVTKTGGQFGKNIKSAIESEFEISTNIADRITGGSDSPTGAYYKKGAWLCFRFPFSPNNIGAGVTVGNVYGTATPAAGRDNLEPSVFETQNMTYTSRGERGFNTPTSEDFGQAQGIAFVMKIQNRDIADGVRDGEVHVRCTAFDTFDNVMIQDFIVPWEDVWHPFDLPFSGFSLYRSRKPRFYDLTGAAILNLKLPKELELYNTFAWRRLKLISFQVQDFYDEFGRYAPENAGQETSFPINNISLSKVFGGTFRMAIDDFHFTKPLLAIASAADVTNRDLETEFLQRTHIMTYDQLLNDARTQVELERFQHKQYDFKSSGKNIFDIRVGDTFFFEEEKLVEEQDDTTSGETGKKKIKLVAKRIEYYLTSPPTGVGGLTRRIIGSRRFT